MGVPSEIAFDSTGQDVVFEPFIDGIKIIKDNGKPLLFGFEGPDQATMERNCRVIEELR